MMNFFKAISKFNAMYRLPMPAKPTLEFQRFSSFQGSEKSIIGEEFLEGGDIITGYMAGASEADVLTAQADWLGDMIVYCTSEMQRYGLNPETVLDIIMQSNFSKLDASGLPIYDERGKVMKGPNYWKPESKLKAYIEKVMSNEL
jgi:hypothetical protein